MAICSYYLRGACKYGDRCRNEHPGASGNFGNQSWISSSNRVATSYTVETLAADVTPLKDKPLWPLSSYGPSKHEPVVISGLDESPEELRLKAVTTLKAGTPDEYTKYEGERNAAADQVYANARNNIRQLYEQALKVSAQAHASASTVSSSAPTLTGSAPSAFGVGSTPTAFGGMTTTAFGKPAFAHPTFGQTGFGGSANPSGTSTFSQGTQGTSAFGTPTLHVSVFSQPSQATSVFGQAAQTTSAFSQPTQPASAFAQPSTQLTSVFGKPSPSTSVFAQSSQPTSVFGQPSQPTSAFAQPTQPSSAFLQSSQPAFGQSSLIKSASGAFGGTGGGGFSAFASQPSTFTSAAAPSSSTTGTMPVPSTFGSTTLVQSAFGTTPSIPKSVFGTSQQPPFGITSPGNTLPVSTMLSPASAIGGGPFASSPMTVTPSSEKPASAILDFASAKLTAKMRPGADRYLSLLPSNYKEMIPVDAQAAFTAAKFEWGKIPDWIPPEDVR